MVSLKMLIHLLDLRHVKVPYSIKFSLDKILSRVHTLYWDKNFAEFNFAKPRFTLQEVVGGANGHTQSLAVPHTWTQS